MPSARLSRAPSVAVMVHLAAALVALATMIVVPLSFASAATGRQGVPTAFAVAALAALLTLATTFAARSVDPLRR